MGVGNVLALGGAMEWGNTLGLGGAMGGCPGPGRGKRRVPWFWERKQRECPGPGPGRRLTAWLSQRSGS